MKEQLSKEKERLFTLQSQANEFSQRLFKKQRVNLNPREVELHQNFLRALREKEKRQKKRIQDLESDMEEKRQKLVRASQEKKTMEKLTEKAAAAWKKEESSKEQKAIDERACRQSRIQGGKMILHGAGVYHEKKNL